MRYFILLIIAFFLLQPAYAADHSYGDIGPGTYVRNYDGDTITFDISGVHPILGDHIPVRVYGIDTPEIRGKCSREKTLAKKAKRTVRQLLEGAQVITLKDTSRGKYFRIVAKVMADGVSVGEVLISKGLAVPYDGGHKSKSWCN